MSVPENMSALHILGFLYLSFTHSTDGALSESEIVKIADILQKWVPSAPREGIAKVMSEAAGWYNTLDTDDARRDAVRETAGMLREGLSDKQRAHLLLSLIELARADGTVTAEEEDFINFVKSTFEVGAAS
ncbi:MAG: TerB family tellurite resistance protein [Nannocystaceae bacterium]|nr:TerB family tellurite resistance protein [Myxococcales bacterium]